jgi:hypothetical protein
MSSWFIKLHEQSIWSFFTGLASLTLIHTHTWTISGRHHSARFGNNSTSTRSHFNLIIFLKYKNNFSPNNLFFCAHNKYEIDLRHGMLLSISYRFLHTHSFTLHRLHTKHNKIDTFGWGKRIFLSRNFSEWNGCMNTNFFVHIGIFSSSFYFNENKATNFCIVWCSALFVFSTKK